MNLSTRFWKIISVILGIIIVALGLFSHLDSDWRIANQREDPCQQSYLFVYNRSSDWCPHISLEWYFVGINIICLITSLFSVCFSTQIEKPSHVVKRLDILYHWVAVLLLLLAGILYIASALQVLSLRLHAGRREMKMRTTEKVVAGGLTIVQAVVYGTIATFLGRRD
ncbi:hypothetical protein Ocin01_17806 [Orchesella cincta]|uniref:Uncharacterized protein n=1 Tax=Orchesella cincta TaxID=48709 RepID=A0A1D2M7H3_ORCCI|nr:hypothetical protein Ocin01_17806 [Orchesella cincta]